METIIKFIKKVRAIIMRNVRTADSYLKSSSVHPISTRYGFDRGKPIDRTYIEKFLEDCADSIYGRCLEIVDNTYTIRYGKDKITTSDILDIFPTKKSNIHGDLRNLKEVKDNTYDCLIVTQTLYVVDDFETAIAESYRILKPGGTLLVTLPTISPAWNLKINFWRVTAGSARYVFSKYFSSNNIEIKSFGNKTSALYFWLGMAIEDMSSDELEKNDPNFPLIIGIAAKKVV